VVRVGRRRGSWRSGKMPAIGGGWSCRKIERGKQEEEDENMFVNFAKAQGVHCKVKFLPNYSSNENMLKIQSVELKKIYHFALGSNFKIVRVLKLFLKPTNHSISNKSNVSFTFLLKP
jgi:hypothetical protein